MQKVTQAELKDIINNNRVVVLVITTNNCANCTSLKRNIIPNIEKKLPTVKFIEFNESADVYPINELMKQFDFRTVPTSIIYVSGEPKKAIKGITFLREFIQAIQQLM